MGEKESLDKYTYTDDCFIFGQVSADSRSNFDDQVLKAWDNFMKLGYFRYPLETYVPSRVIPGKFGYIAQLQLNRVTQRRPPQSMLHLQQPFDPNLFNFTKIKDEKELIFEMQKKGKNGKACGRDVLITNVSPLEYGHCLLVPSVESCLPQVLTEYSVKLALETVLLSSSSMMRLGFNSLCAHASVNHLHWHLYFNQHQLKLQTIPLTRNSNNIPFYYINEEDYPAVGFVFLLDSIDQLAKTAANVFKLANWLSESDVAHNVFITRAAGPDGGDAMNHVRVFVWARESIMGAKDPGDFVMAVCELSGQVLVYKEEAYEPLTEEAVADAQRAACHQIFSDKKSQVEIMFTN